MECNLTAAVLTVARRTGSAAGGGASASSGIIESSRGVSIHQLHLKRHQLRAHHTSHSWEGQRDFQRCRRRIPTSCRQSWEEAPVLQVLASQQAQPVQ